MAITEGDKIPSPANGTLEATATGIMNPLVFTFTVSNQGGGALLSFSTSLSGTDKEYFSVDQPTVDQSGTFATFQVTYTPEVEGTQTVVVHVATNDPVYPDFEFTLGATDSPFIDLAADVGKINLGKHADDVSGSARSYRIPVAVQNQGNVPVPKSTPPLDFQILLQNTSSNALLLIATPTSTGLRSLGAGKTKRLDFNISVPISVPTGDYEFIIEANDPSLLAETSSANNRAVSLEILSVTQGQYGLAGTLGTSSFPATIAAGQELSGKLQLSLENTGNLALPAHEPVAVELFAFNTSTMTYTPLGAAGTLTLAAIAPGKSTHSTISGMLPAGLSSGTYELSASLTPLGSVPDLTSLALTANSAGGVVTISVL